MTAGELLSNNSTVSNVSAWEHLINPSGTGGGNIITVNTFYKSLKVLGVRKQSVIKSDKKVYNIKTKSKSKKVVIENKEETVKRLDKKSVKVRK